MGVQAVQLAQPQQRQRMMIVFEAAMMYDSADPCCRAPCCERPCQCFQPARSACFCCDSFSPVVRSISFAVEAIRLLRLSCSAHVRCSYLTMLLKQVLSWRV